MQAANLMLQQQLSMKETLRNVKHQEHAKENYEVRDQA
jgi:hypothetical protein